MSDLPPLYGVIMVELTHNIESSHKSSEIYNKATTSTTSIDGIYPPIPYQPSGTQIKYNTYLPLSIHMMEKEQYIFHLPSNIMTPRTRLPPHLLPIMLPIHLPAPFHLLEKSQQRSGI